jgi:hypothetical protein
MFPTVPGVHFPASCDFIQEQLDAGAKGFFWDHKKDGDWRLEATKNRLDTW